MEEELEMNFQLIEDEDEIDDRQTEVFRQQKTLRLSEFNDLAR